MPTIFTDCSVTVAQKPSVTTHPPFAVHGIKAILGNVLAELTGDQRRQIGLGAVMDVDAIDIALKVEARRRRATDKSSQPIGRLKLTAQYVHLPKAAADGLERQLKLRRPLRELTLMLFVASQAFVPFVVIIRASRPRSSTDNWLAG